MKSIFRKEFSRSTVAALRGGYAKELCELRPIHNSKGCMHILDNHAMQR
ncbi:MAG: hypothetical protein U5N27_24350 [Rhizobium sp.]|nr:hypothetical protein [Rhizobium sp.]